jgi:hypothetical protein
MESSLFDQRNVLARLRAVLERAPGSAMGTVLAAWSTAEYPMFGLLDGQF